MRIYTNFKEVLSEIKRDLIEMGQPISTYSMQNKIVEWNSDYETKEITNYSFCLSNFDHIEDMIDFPEFEKAELNRIDKYFETHKFEDYRDYVQNKYQIILVKKDDIKLIWKKLLQIWLNEDFQERIKPQVNPWEAYKLRPWVWEEFLHKWNKTEMLFDYTYSERINISDLFKEMIKHPMSRQYVYNIWDTKDREFVNGKKRIPCSLSYQVLIRPNWELDSDGKQLLAVNIIYTMRSCDFLTHFPIDIIQAVRLLQYFVKHLNNWKKDYSFVPGKLYYNCASLHLYKKDLIEDVF